jgi:hypothetical protein
VGIGRLVIRDDGSGIWNRLELGALPGGAGVLAAQSGEGRQDTAGKAALAAIDSSASLLAHQVIFGQVFLAHRAADVLPGEGFVDQALAVGVEGGIEAGFAESLQP